MAKFNFLDIRGTKKVPSAFGNVFICSGAIGDAKTVTFPDGYLNGAVPEPNLAFTAVFANGHNAANASSYLSLNGIVVVSNQNGALLPLPVHAMTEGDSTVYKVLQANTPLELYYTADYDGNNTPAFVVIGNPVVLSSSDYTIYANGKTVYEPVDSVTNGAMNPVTSNAVYDDKTTSVTSGSSKSVTSGAVYNAVSEKMAKPSDTPSVTRISAWSNVIMNKDNDLSWAAAQDGLLTVSFNNGSAGGTITMNIGGVTVQRAPNYATTGTSGTLVALVKKGSVVTLSVDQSNKFRLQNALLQRIY